MQSMFQRVRAVLEDHSVIIHEQILDEWRAPTLVVIGEYHKIPEVQCDVFSLLCAVHDAVGIGAYGVEGDLTKLSWHQGVMLNPGRLLSDTAYMADLLERGPEGGQPEQRMDAMLTFYRVFADDFVLGETAIVAEDEELRRQSAEINDRCLAWINWGFENPEMQQVLLEVKEVVMRQRSIAMTNNTYDAMLRSNKHFGVLVVGSAHTPMHEVYEPYSVTQALRHLPVNALVAVPESVLRVQEAYLNAGKDPFNFWEYPEIQIPSR